MSAFTLYSAVCLTSYSHSRICPMHVFSLCQFVTTISRCLSRVSHLRSSTRAPHRIGIALQQSRSHTTSHTRTAASQLSHRPMSAPAACSSPIDTAKVGHPAWHGPFGESALKVHNSLTSTKTPFLPAKEKFVGWYTCGPTVYDSAHLGHARWSENTTIQHNARART